ncbi:MAG: hypothetical protein JWO53_286 [Chlamydiia bacterium]|nr:hypothetical protein [Chlamydiia bacterium]
MNSITYSLNYAAYAVFKTVPKIGYYTLDGSAKVVQNSDSMNQFAKLVQVAVDAFVPKGGYPEIRNTCKVFTDFASARNCIGSLNGVLKEEATVLDRLISASRCLADTRTTLEWFDSIDLCKLGTISSSIGSTGICRIAFDFVMLPGIKNTFGIIGSVIELGKFALTISEKGLKGSDGVLLVIKIAGSVAKIAIVVFAGPVSAKVIASVCSLIGNLADEYKKEERDKAHEIKLANRARCHAERKAQLAARKAQLIAEGRPLNVLPQLPQGAALQQLQAGQAATGAASTNASAELPPERLVKDVSAKNVAGMAMLIAAVGTVWSVSRRQ